MVAFLTPLGFCQLAGVVAVEVTGGPTIHFVPGRQVGSWRKLLITFLKYYS